MYTDEKAKQLLHEHSNDITALKENAKSIHKRIDEANHMASSIQNLATSVAEMATEIKCFTMRMDSSIERIEQGQKEQGMRITDNEKAILTISRNEKTIADHDKRINAIEKEPAVKWNKLSWVAITGVASAIISFLMAQLL